MDRRYLSKAILVGLTWPLPLLGAEPPPVPGTTTPTAPPAAAPPAAAPPAAAPPAAAPPAAAPPAAAPPAAAPPAAAPPAAAPPAPTAPPPVSYTSPEGPAPGTAYVLVPVEPRSEPPRPRKPAPPSPSDRKHDGFYLRLSIGPSYFWDKIKTKPDNGLDEKMRGSMVSLDVLVGGAVTDGLILGGGLWLRPGVQFRVESGGVTNHLEDDYNLYFAQLGPFVDYYIDPKQGFHLQGAVSYAVLNVETDDPYYDDTFYDYTTTLMDPTGFSFLAGVGYDFWISRQWSAGILANLSYAILKEDTDTGTDTHRILSPSLTATFTMN